ncbi:MAG TPA: 50S ribosomal protein L23 [Dehalococcoidia bacterium]|nr:50S ribosomal protein L23 [Dehalococcoidia bacterium]
MHPYEVLRRPLITEKATVLKEQGKYVFEVAGEAGKHQIKQAVELAFNVQVTGVNVVTLPGKMKRAGRRRLTTPSMKKAIVTLAPGSKIEFFEGI